jgi:arylformamidase
MAKTTKNNWIDVSVPLANGMAHWPGDPEFQMDLAKSLDRGDVCNLTRLATSAHIGTHMDAPRHFIKNGVGMDKVPLHAVIGPCRVVQIRDQESIKPAELEPHRLQRGERVLFKTRNSTRSWASPEFDKNFVYVSKEAAAFLVQRKVQTIGVDYLSVGGFFKDGVPTHQILLGAKVWIIEGLNLARIKPGDYDLICLPVKIQGADGAPARVVLRPI